MTKDLSKNYRASGDFIFHKAKLLRTSSDGDARDIRKLLGF